MPSPATDTPPGPARPATPLRITRVSWSDLVQATGFIVVLSVLAVAATLHFVRPAPPRALTIASGPKGSTFETMAGRYQKLLAKSGIDLRILNTEGSIDNLRRLEDAHSGVDIALVQSGLESTAPDARLESLGSVFFEPLTVFYRAPHPVARLSDLAGRRISIGREGSGTRALALALLKANGIEPGGATTLVSLENDAALQALLARRVDAIFLAGDSASPAAIRALLHEDSVRLYDFPQADAYVRRFPYLNKLALPAGAFDLGENLPANPINLLGPTVELVAHHDLHPALSDLLIEAAFHVHGRASLLQSAGQFPTPATHAFPLSDEATRYYKSGSKSFAYRYLPFWLASLLDRALVVLVPIFVVVIPGLRFLPQLYSWRIRSRIHRRYSELMALERETLDELTAERRDALLARLADIERSVITGKMPGAYADQVYVLREHIAFVRSKLAARA